MIRIGIVGTGGMARQRAGLLQSMDDAEVGCVCSRSVERAGAICDLTNAVFCADYGDALKDADAIVVCAPNALHADFALRALEAGKHVLVEYPLCVSATEADALQAAAETSGGVLMVGNTIIHEAMYKYVAENIERIGAPLSASSRVAFYGETCAGAWYMDPEMRGPVFAALHYHHIEYYRRFLGEPRWVMAGDEGRPDAERAGLLSTTGGTMAMGHASGATSCIQWYLSASGDGTPRGMWINGTTGSMSIVSTARQMQSFVVWDDGGEGKTEVFDNEWGVLGSCGDFIHAIRGEMDHLDRLESDIATLKVGLAASESSGRGGPVWL